MKSIICWVGILLFIIGCSPSAPLEKFQEMCPEIDELCEEDFIRMCELSCERICPGIIGIVNIPIPVPSEPWYEKGKVYRIHGEIYTYEELEKLSILTEEDIGDTIARWIGAGYPLTLKTYIEKYYENASN